jgi:outer membrane protein OmpA-like peptidoglycan-associated protein
VALAAVRRTAALLIAGVAAVAAAPAPQAPERIDYLTFAHGAVPIRIGGAGAGLGASFTHAVQWIDGDPSGFSFVLNATAATDTEFVYALPALTTFDRFAVPNVVETPSPLQTFTRLVEVHGSATSPDDGYVLLASATLQPHQGKGQVTELTIAATRPVRWVTLRVVGGIDLPKQTAALEFSEIIGNGTQETPAMADHFTGTWQDRGVRLQLRQDGPVVSGCYDKSGTLTGTVTGNIVRATGIDADDKTVSAFILSVAPDGAIRGVRSTNRGPFRLYSGAAAAGGATVTCTAPPPPALGCGSIIHGITFAFDSAEIRPESLPVLQRLHEGLRADRRASIVIEGHTSSEGDEAYNLRLSERRAQSVVAELVRRGLDKTRIAGLGVGESRPISSNADESGRSMNRRVEVRCK